MTRRRDTTSSSNFEFSGNEWTAIVPIVAFVGIIIAFCVYRRYKARQAAAMTASAVAAPPLLPNPDGTYGYPYATHGVVVVATGADGAYLPSPTSAYGQQCGYQHMPPAGGGYAPPPSANMHQPYSPTGYAAPHACYGPSAGYAPPAGYHSPAAAQHSPYGAGSYEMRAVEAPAPAAPVTAYDGRYSLPQYTPEPHPTAESDASGGGFSHALPSDEKDAEFTG